jgi:preprotein translocase subunit SecG
MEVFMYSILTIFALAEIGVTAYLIDHFTKVGYPSSRYRSLTIFLLFNACWTAFFGLAYIIFVAAGVLKRLARLTASLAWLTITLILWVIAASLYTDPTRGGRGEQMCRGLPALDICRKTQAAQALAWTIFAFCILTMIVSILSWHEDRPPPAPSTTVSDSMPNDRFEQSALNVLQRKDQTA